MIRHIKKLLHWTATKRLKLGTNDAQLYTRLLTYLLFIGVLVSALVFVNIPLAVFTFFGGALAIGIGFGAQTLINNFISGLILMFDRTIRMGDMVEVDGHRGRVASIGMRSSSIKRFDGVEMLVPNSVFLQQNVINWTSSDPRARYSISVGVAYGSPTREVERVILQSGRRPAGSAARPAAVCGVREFCRQLAELYRLFLDHTGPGGEQPGGLQRHPPPDLRAARRGRDRHSRSRSGTCTWLPASRWKSGWSIPTDLRQ